MMRIGETSVGVPQALRDRRAARDEAAVGGLGIAPPRRRSQRRTSTTAPTLIVPSCSGMYQNQPSPKAAERMWLRELARQALGAAEVAEDGQVLEELVEAAQPERAAEERALSAGVDHEARARPRTPRRPAATPRSTGVAPPVSIASTACSSCTSAPWSRAFSRRS